VVVEDGGDSGWGAWWTHSIHRTAPGSSIKSSPANVNSTEAEIFPSTLDTTHLVVSRYLGNLPLCVAPGYINSRLNSRSQFHDGKKDKSLISGPGLSFSPLRAGRV
jgi:hypothetical protein